MNIRDYLPYYIGQKYRYQYVDWKEGSWLPWLILTLGRLNRLEDASIDKIQLALRRLEDMTEEEAVELIKLTEWHHYGDHPFSRRYETYRNSFGQIVVKWGEHPRCFNVPVTKEVFRPEEIHYLLQRGFDLFSLIENGLAVDVKTIEK